MARLALFAWILTISGIGFASGAPGDPADPDSSIVFPSVEGSNLAGKKYALPRDFEGRLNIVLIAFKREQQTLVDTWLPVGRYLEGAYPDIRCYEIPTLPKLNAVARYFIDNGMRGGIPDRTARERTITLYIEKEPFRQALQIAGEETIHALLLDERDRVIWRSEGARSDESARALTEAVKKAIRAAGE